MSTTAAAIEVGPSARPVSDRTRLATAKAACIAASNSDPTMQAATACR